MQNILLASDLDNTLLFSWRHRQEGDVCVEWLDGREQGFCTPGSLAMLAELNRELLFVPVTSRSVEQYRRIAWPAACRPRYAVTTNGGILLAEGEVDRQWLARTRELIEPWQNELRELEIRLTRVPINKRSRMVDDIYLFAACDKREDAQALGALLKGSTSLDTAVSGRKVYFFPPLLNKGEALLRLKVRLRPDKTLCAGDTISTCPCWPLPIWRLSRRRGCCRRAWPGSVWSGPARTLVMPASRILCWALLLISGKKQPEFPDKFDNRRLQLL